MRSKASVIALVVAATFLLSSCGVVGFVDSACVKIKKQSELKREIGTTFLDMFNSGQIGEGITPQEVEMQGYKSIIEGTELVVENPQCFSEQEVKTAKSLLGR
jgi:hypothetical protein